MYEFLLFLDIPVSHGPFLEAPSYQKKKKNHPTTTIKYCYPYLEILKLNLI